MSITDLTFPIDVHLVDLPVNSRSNWIDINLLVPCHVDVSWDGAKFLVFPSDEALSDFLRFSLRPTFVALIQVFVGKGSFDAGIRCPT